MRFKDGSSTIIEVIKVTKAPADILPFIDS
jgi:hypothetical protein